MTSPICSSGNSSSSSSPRSGDSRKFDSDTTPSPSGYRGQEIDPQILSGKLSLYEASQSLSLAADTLAAAAQAMSKAASSLAVASGYFATKPTPEASRTFVDIQSQANHFTRSISPEAEWQQTSYILSDNKPASEQEPIAPPELDAPNIDSCEREHASLSPNGVRSLGETHHEVNQGSSSAVSNGSKVLTANQLTKPSSESPQHAQDSTIDGLKAEKKKKVGNINPNQDVGESRADIKPNSKVPVQPLAQSDELQSRTSAPVLALGTDTTHSRPSISIKSSIILDRLFDQIPTVALLSQQYAKTVCIYKYKEGIQALLETLSVLVGPGKVLAACDSSAKKRGQKLRSFIDGTASILLWWSEHKVLDSYKIVEAEFQVVHIGVISPVNKHADFPRSFVVTSNQEMSPWSSNQTREFNSAYTLSSLNSSCNDQSNDSPLNAFRVKVRAQFAADSAARAFYGAFFSYHITRSPSWSAQELAKRANEYATEYLLRGDSKPNGSMVGGRIPLTREEVVQWRLQSAVDSGEVLVI